MITRAAIFLALVWLCLPHNPNLGLPAAATCSGTSCIIVSEADRRREVIFARLRQVRSEIRAGRGDMTTTVPPDRAARLGRPEP